jgi:hypothetical protein
VRLATHQGFLSNREGGQGVTEADESTKNSHGGTVHCGGDNWKMWWSRWGLMGKEWLGGTEEDTHPDLAHRRGARVGGYGGEENNVCAWLKRVQNQTTGGPLWVMPRGGRGSTGPSIPTTSRPTAVRLYFSSGAPTRLKHGPRLLVGEGVRRKRRGCAWAGPGRKRVGRA